MEPVHAVAYHFLNEEATRFNLFAAIRETYDGPLSMATDNMVWNVTPNGVRERMAVITEDAWSVPGPTRQGPPEQAGRRPVFSEFSNAGYWLPAYEAQNAAMDEHMAKYNLQDQDWRPGLFKQIRDAQK
jgi:ribonuclease Z